MATDYSRDIARQLEKLVAEQHETNKRLKKLEEAVMIRNFDELVPPPKGTAVMNMNGVVCISGADFKEMDKAYRSYKENKDDERNERTD